MYSFTAACISNRQGSDGKHVATLQGGDGRDLVIPTDHQTFILGNTYTISVDGKFADPPKPAPKPEPVKPPVAAAPVPPANAPTA